MNQEERACSNHLLILFENNGKQIIVDDLKKVTRKIKVNNKF